MLLTETFFIARRPRRNRKTAAIRELLEETVLLPSDIISPFFVVEGDEQQEEIAQLPGVYRYSVDLLIDEAQKLYNNGIKTIALFPVVSPELRDVMGSEAYNPDGLIPWAIRMIKKELPEMTIVCDVALDPYTSSGHDGIVDENNCIDNDKTLAILAKQALMQAAAGVDIVAPSDMMDGRIGYIREELDRAGYTDVSILSYTAKYASALYGPFRSALNTKLAFGDKKTYQMNPANKKEALLEAELDVAEGADMLMVKPATLYLDIISDLASRHALPVGAYHVSGEYAMVMAAHNAGYLDASATFFETLLSIKRAGARFIFTYASNQILPFLHD